MVCIRPLLGALLGRLFELLRSKCRDFSLMIHEGVPCKLQLKCRPAAQTPSVKRPSTPCFVGTAMPPNATSISRMSRSLFSALTTSPDGNRLSERADGQSSAVVSALRVDQSSF